MPGINGQLYNQVLMENIVKNMPDVQFYFFGNKAPTQIPKPYKNLEVLGWVDPMEVIKKSTALLRFTQHDGLPTSPMEFSMAGRFVLTNAEMPYVEKIEGYVDVEGKRKEIIEQIRALKKRVKNGEKPDPKAGEYYREYLNPDKIKARLYGLL